MECRRLYTLIALFRAKPGRNGVQSTRGRSPGSADHSTSVICGIRVHPSYICESSFSLRYYQRHDTEVSTETERRPLPRSPEHLLPDIRSRKRRGRHEEDRRTDMGDVLVERIRRAQPGLQRLKMRRVVLVGNEQQPRIQKPEPIDTVGIVVGTPENLEAAIVLVGGQPDMRRLGYDQFPFRVLLCKIRRVEFIRPRQR